MICFNCGKCIPPEKISVLKLIDTEENPLITRILCFECGKKLALALLKARKDDA